MKISNEQKKENRKKMIRAAVSLMIDKGLKNTTMRTIAKDAGLGEATIYNYFPTKESILFAYYEEKLMSGIENLKKIPEFNKYNFQEQLQTYFETMLELFLPDREFVALSIRPVFFSISSDFKRLKKSRDLFFSVLDDIFQAAIEVEEIPELYFKEITYQFFWDYFIGMVFYWLKDRSDNFTDTSLLLDKTMDLACVFIKTGVGNKLFDIASFLFKSQIVSRMDFLRDRIDTIHKIKREFMGSTNAG
jgi:AcrR family transcriptional regulator